MDKINPNLLNARYSLRGELTLRVEELKKILKQNPQSLPFSKIICCNLGDPLQFTQQKPLIYLRQISSLLEMPELLELDDDSSKESLVLQLFPKEVVEKARILAKEIRLGPYSNSKGIEYIRKLVAKFIWRRDGKRFSSHYNDIFLTNGASAGISAVLNMLIKDGNSGIMVPIPEYPLYSASITLFGGQIVHYHLNEEDDWALDMQDIQKAYANAIENGIQIAAFVVINPGNPTGNLLSPENQRKIVEFCFEKQIPLLADEVYQENVYSAPFVSFKRIASEYAECTGNQIQLFSFHSVSKGFLGECGRRGGYLECFGLSQIYLDALYKYASLNLCANLSGQLAVAVMVDDEFTGDEEQEQEYHSEIRQTWHQHRQKTLSQYVKKANILHEGLSKLPGIECKCISGAMYLFPKIHIPQNACIEARKASKSPDEFYCLRLLNEMGICILPGSCFGQAEGTFHFRVTILPSEEELHELLEKLSRFHLAFMKEYS